MHLLVATISIWMSSVNTGVSLGCGPEQHSRRLDRVLVIRGFIHWGGGSFVKMNSCTSLRQKHRIRTKQPNKTVSIIYQLWAHGLQRPAGSSAGLSCILTPVRFVQDKLLHRYCRYLYTDIKVSYVFLLLLTFCLCLNWSEIKPVFIKYILLDSYINIFCVTVVFEF